MTYRHSDKTTGDILRSDAVHDAEQITGKRWSEWNQEEQRLALGLQMRHVDATRRVLESRDDVHFETTLTEFERIVGDIGFEKVMEIEFHDERHEPHTEAMKVWWWPSRGVLLKYDTWYSQAKVNSGNLCYNWKINDGLSWSDRCGCTSSSSPNGDGSIAGSHDCREAVRFNLARLEANGKFIVPWQSCRMPYFSLLHYLDYYEHEKTPMKERMIANLETEIKRCESISAEVLAATGMLTHFKERLGYVTKSKTGW